MCFSSGSAKLGSMVRTTWQVGDTALITKTNKSGTVGDLVTVSEVHPDTLRRGFRGGRRITGNPLRILSLTELVQLSPGSVVACVDFSDPTKRVVSYLTKSEVSIDQPNMLYALVRRVL